MIDSRECAAMAQQALEEAHEASHESARLQAEGQPNKADRWRRAAAALIDASEAFRRAENEIDAVSVEKG